MGHVIYDDVTNSVWADVKMESAHAVAAGPFCFGFDIFEPKGLFGGININSGDFIVIEFAL